MPASLPSPAGRLQKRLRAARRCWRVSGLQSLLWPFRHRFSLEAAPDLSRPLRAMLEPAPRAAAPHPLPLPAPAAILSEGALPSGLAACRRGGWEAALGKRRGTVAGWGLAGSLKGPGSSRHQDKLPDMPLRGEGTAGAEPIWNRSQSPQFRSLPGTAGRPWRVTACALRSVTSRP